MEGVRVTRIGGPTTLIEMDGCRILTDPTFDPPGRRYNFGWATGSSKLVAPALAPADFGPIDAVQLAPPRRPERDAGPLRRPR
jgi:L-ascorbate metabolism protein UlaG (beta-lactamase superfamily)